MQVHIGRRSIFAAALTGLAGAAPTSALAQDDPLRSWNDGPAKRLITDFLTRVTTQGHADFVSAERRIATFDNDGTLWSEQPMYFQLAFALDRVKALAPQRPDWKTKAPFKAVLSGNHAELAALSEKDLLQIIAETHSGMTVDAFSTIVVDWLKSARHPRFNRPYTDLVFQPMIELLSYLRTKGFKSFIVSGGGIEFMRPWVSDIYGIPPEQVVGSSGAVAYEIRDGKPVLMKLPSVDFIDDGPGKPIGINRFVGRRPILAFGNSDGDQQMLEWTAAGPGASFPALIHHTDAEREWSYDRISSFGKLDKAWDEAARRGWLVVDVKRDWKVVYPFQA